MMMTMMAVADGSPNFYGKREKCLGKIENDNSGTTAAAAAALEHWVRGEAPCINSAHQHHSPFILLFPPKSPS